jgi:hypothetical protein
LPNGIPTPGIHCAKTANRFGRTELAGFFLCTENGRHVVAVFCAVTFSQRAPQRPFSWRRLTLLDSRLFHSPGIGRLFGIRSELR